MKTVKSIMIIDDNPEDVYIAKRMLQRSKHYRNIYSINSAAEALTLFEQYEASRQQDPERFPPLVILLDINMPVMNGFEFLNRYAALPPPANQASVIVMLTSSESAADKQKATEHDAVRGYFTKPLTADAALAIAERFGE